jgi:ketosteroid isomerase-like protein
MKNPILVVSLVLLLCFAFGCQQGKEAGKIPLVDVKAEVQARSKAVVAAEMAFDWDTAVTFYASNAIIQPANAPQIQGREALLEQYRTFPKMLEFGSTSTAIIPSASGDIAYDYGVNRFVFETPNGQVKDLGKYLAVWTKVDGEWLIAALSFSSDTAISK